jgi:histidine triad (HIT) family protein
MAVLLAVPTAAAAADEPMRCPLNAPYDPQNPFAQIIRGEKKQAIVYSDPLVMAFVPLGWENPGHVLIVPKRSVRNLNDMTDQEMLAVFHLIRRIAVAQERAFGSTGYTVQQNNARSQSVCHAHFHVIPNSPKDPVDGATQEQMEAIAAKLRAALPAE